MLPHQQPHISNKLGQGQQKTGKVKCSLTLRLSHSYGVHHYEKHMIVKDVSAWAQEHFVKKKVLNFVPTYFF